MLSVRRLQIGQGELFRAIRLASLREAPDAFFSTVAIEQARSLASWCEQADASAEGPDRSTCIAFWGDTPIGIAALYRHPEGTDTGKILHAWVAPEHRHRGVGTALLDALFRWAAANGFRLIRATVAKENPGAIQFYRTVGFAPADDPACDPAGRPIFMKAVAPAP